MQTSSAEYFAEYMANNGMVSTALFQSGVLVSLSQDLCYFSAMADRVNPVLRTTEAVLLVGKMAVYNSQSEASQRIPLQWRAFRLAYPQFGPGAVFCGASPCTNDHQIHYLTGVVQQTAESVDGLERLTIEPGEYAFVRVDNPTSLRDTWVWLLSDWLPNSGRREKHAPEFERFTSISDAGTPIGPVEIWIPLESVAGN